MRSFSDGLLEVEKVARTDDVHLEPREVTLGIDNECRGLRLPLPWPTGGPGRAP
jgi:hypothetical protein